MKDELSPTMLWALKLAAEKGNGKLRRFPGGRWVAGESWSNAQFGIIGTTSVEALVARGKMRYTNWQKRKKRAPFPIEAIVIIHV